MSIRGQSEYYCIDILVKILYYFRDRSVVKAIMTDLHSVLQEFFERSPYGTIKELTQATRAYTSMSQSYLAHLLHGRRQKPGYDKLVAIAQALNLNKADTNRLLEAAGFATIDHQIQRVVEALRQLSEMPHLTPQALKMIVDGLVLMIDGFKTGLDPSPSAQVASAPRLRTVPATLPPEIGLIDDLLGEILARDEQHPLDVLFRSLEEAAQEDRWEVKRRLAEALPKLVQLQPDATLRLATILRQDYHPDWRADIRRRVVEAVPALHGHRPQEALQLLTYRDQDEVYTAMATVEVLHDLENSGKIPTDVAEQYFQDLHLDEALHWDAISMLRQLLRDAQSDPDMALAGLNDRRAHPERIIRICVQRVAPRLLVSRPVQALELMAYFLRRDEAGQPVEHQNLRRPVSRALPDIFDLLSRQVDLAKVIEPLLQRLADDPDIHVRRALSDALDRLALIQPDLAVSVLEVLIKDQDPYVRQRAWRVLLQLAELYPEQAAGYYGRILTA